MTIRPWRVLGVLGAGAGLYCLISKQSYNTEAWFSYWQITK